MKRNNEREELLADVLTDDDQLRAATLQAGLNEMRRVHKRQRVLRVAGAMTCMSAIIVAMLLSAHRFLLTGRKAADSPSSVTRVEEMIPGTSIHVLSDEQLLEFFRGRPVALVGRPGDQQLLLLDGRN